ncbi:hypothetical protein DM083_30160, partial [Klebsiella pneumoniae]
GCESDEARGHEGAVAEVVFAEAGGVSERRGRAAEEGARRTQREHWRTRGRWGRGDVAGGRGGGGGGARVGHGRAGRQGEVAGGGREGV